MITMSLKITSYWVSIVTQYYAHIQESRSISIWEWLEQDFGAVRMPHGNHGNAANYSTVMFADEANVSMFVLRFS
jgi:hypothetical protein